MIYESGGWLGRRAVWWLIHGRVFERHPDLRLVVTEQYEGWFIPTLRELDSVYARFGRTLSGDQLPRLPSEYGMANVFVGASFMSGDMAEEAWREGYATNVIWGSDYPHVEGTFQHLDDADAEPITRLALRHTLSRVPREAALLMAGLNGVRVYGLDGDELQRVAARIGAPTAAELSTPPASLPPISPRSNRSAGRPGPGRRTSPRCSRRSRHTGLPARRLRTQVALRHRAASRACSRPSSRSCAAILPSRISSTVAHRTSPRVPFVGRPSRPTAGVPRNQYSTTASRSPTTRCVSWYSRSGVLAKTWVANARRSS